MPFPLIEYRVREDFVAKVRQRAAERDVTVSAVVRAALASFMDLALPAPLMSPAQRTRLAVRLPPALIAATRSAAAAQSVSPRMVVEGALAREFATARPPSWDPNRPSAEP